MPAISIENLAINVPHLTEPQARQLALGIAEGLAAAGVSQMEAEVPTLRVDLTATSGDDAARLAGKVVEEILRQVRRQG